MDQLGGVETSLFATGGDPADLATSDHRGAGASTPLSQDTNNSENINPQGTSNQHPKMDINQLLHQIMNITNQSLETRRLAAALQIQELRASLLDH